MRTSARQARWRRSGTLAAIPWGPLPGITVRSLPSRQVASAKSWLAYGGVDRTAPILPFGHEAGERAVSPVEASARYLAHMRDAWNATHARGDAALQFEHQRIVLTVPASFDEEARELTIAAATQAGLVHLTVIEEPLAALYAWIASNRRALENVPVGGRAHARV